MILGNIKKLTGQGWGLRKTKQSPEVPDHEILGAQHLYGKSNNNVFQSLKGESSTFVFE